MNTDEIRVTSSTGGQKGSKQARFDLLPPALWEVAELYGRGAAKYDDHNWRKGYAWSLSYAAMQRHANLFWSGQDYDEETGCHHLAAVVFHALALLTFKDEHPEFDDRFIPTDRQGECASVSQQSIDPSLRELLNNRFNRVP